MRGDMTLHDAHLVTQNIESALKQKFGDKTHIGIHMEPEK